MNRNSTFIELTDASFDENVLRRKAAILVVICAEWSGACHILRRTLKQFAAHLKNRFTIGYLDIDTNERTAKEYGVHELPILLFYKNGELQDHIAGLVPKRQLKNKLETFCE